MAKFELDIEQINKICTNITVISENKGWFEVAESRKKIHGSKKLIEFDKSFESKDGGYEKEAKAEEIKKIKKSMNLLNTVDKRSDYYNNVNKSFVLMENTFPNLRRNPEVRYDLIEKTYEVPTIVHYHDADSFDLTPDDQLYTLGDVYLENAKRIISDIFRKRTLEIYNLCLKPFEELKDGNELLDAIKKKTKYKYLEKPIELVDPDNKLKLLPDEVYQSYRVIKKSVMDQENQLDSLKEEDDDLVI